MRELLSQPASPAELLAALAVVLAVIAGGVAIGRADEPTPAAERGSGTRAATSPGGPPDRAAGQRGNGTLWEGGGFRIATVREGASIGLYERPGQRLVGRVGDRTEFGSMQSFSVMDRRRRWLRVATSESSDNGPLWIPANRNALEFDNTRVSVHADLVAGTVELRRRGEIRRVFEVTIGAAGTSTPVGRFAVTDIIVGGLNPVYGCCAIALTAHQPNLPTGWIGGDRVAIHGTVGPVGGASSSGCLRASDEDARVLTRALRPGSPVFITS